MKTEYCIYLPDDTDFVIEIGRSYSFDESPERPEPSCAPRDDIAFKGRCVVVDRYENGPYRSGILTDPTWGELHQCAETWYLQAGDPDHCFFEGFGQEAYIMCGVEAVAVLRLYMGS